jgi:hypothetical protein
MDLTVGEITGFVADGQVGMGDGKGRDALRQGQTCKMAPVKETAAIQAGTQANEAKACFSP